ncbi:MAG: NAD(P)/FAD-dependent oxidoreductase [Parasphingopyxis sp.]|uniref:NAD(P)/FAD-dependent oxidoreductase n=1 Tax=Parasphingopyxis sp. TaxID=1920299 RepID=UPI003FA04E75
MGAHLEGKKRQIVVVGGGAGGLELVRRLAARYGNRDHDIILVDKNVSHIWKPLLHEVAAGSLDANLDEVGYGGHAARWNYRFFHGELEKIDREERQIITAPSYDDRGRLITSRHSIRYDYLVLAVGGISNDFGVAGVREHAMFLEHRGQADEFRQRLLNACLRTNDENRRGKQDAKVRVAIVGGGATGVELAAELYNAAKALRHYGLEVFDESKLEVTLVEAGPRILPALDPELADTAREELEALGVSVRVDTQVVRVDEDCIETADGNRLETEITVWAAGVKGADELPFESDLETTSLNTFLVKPTLQTTKDDRIFAIGDCASCLLPGEDRPVPPRAQAAHQMADSVLDNLERLRRGKEPKPFRYRDHGSLVSLSRFSTVGSLMGNLVGGRMAIEGRLARLAYLSLYRLHIIAIHGWRRGIAMILLGHVNRVVRPKLKLH